MTKKTSVNSIKKCPKTKHDRKFKLFWTNYRNVSAKKKQTPENSKSKHVADVRSWTRGAVYSELWTSIVRYFKYQNWCVLRHFQLYPINGHGLILDFTCSTFTKRMIRSYFRTCRQRIIEFSDKTDLYLELRRYSGWKLQTVRVFDIVTSLKTKTSSQRQVNIFFILNILKDKTGKKTIICFVSAIFREHNNLLPNNLFKHILYIKLALHVNAKYKLHTSG